MFVYFELISDHVSPQIHTYILKQYLISGPYFTPEICVKYFLKHPQILEKYVWSPIKSENPKFISLTHYPGKQSCINRFRSSANQLEVLSWSSISSSETFSWSSVFILIFILKVHFHLHFHLHLRFYLHDLHLHLHLRLQSSSSKWRWVNRRRYSYWKNV